MRFRSTAAALVFVVLAACGDTATDVAPGRLTVAVTTSVLGDITAAVAGDDAEVEVLIPPGADPHAYQPSARQAVSLRDADLIVTNGLGLEEGLADVVAAAAGDGVPVLEIGPLVDPLRHPGDGAFDPHVWMDPIRMGAAATAIGDALARADETGAGAGWLDRAAAYRDAMAQLDAEVAALVASLPEERRKLVTNHDALEYFAQRYGFAVLGTVIPGGSTTAQPSAADLADLVAVIEAEHVPAIFVDATGSTDIADAVAAEAGRPVAVVELATGSLGDPPFSTYPGLILENARRIVEALQ